MPTALIALAACGLNFARLYRWAGERATTEPLVLILHVAYAFVPLGFVLLALAILTPWLVDPSEALHGWTAGAIGVMTLAVMTRASFGLTGRPLTATRPIKFIYAAAFVAALARIVAAFDVLREPMLHISATAWVLAFGGFVSFMRRCMRGGAHDVARRLPAQGRTPGRRLVAPARRR